MPDEVRGEPVDQPGMAGRIAAQTKMLREDIPFLAVVTKAVSQEKKDRLEKDGVAVVVVDDVKLPWWVKTGVKKWKDQFTK